MSNDVSTGQSATRTGSDLHDPIAYMRAAWADYLTNAYRHAVATMAVRVVDADAEFRGQPLTSRERSVAAASAAVALFYAIEETP